jgi:2-hydroxycyclohexanecarboxyl-CoA dehydrogenase
MAPREDFSLDGALALVTGAGSGIGRETSLALAGHGCRVLAVDLVADAAEKTATACTERGPESHGLVCDVGDAEAVTALAERVHDLWGPLDILVNNAGVGMSTRWTDMSVDDWNWIRRVNLDGVVHGCLAFGPAMVERGRGHIVNISSILAYTPHALVGAYGATKAAVLSLSQSLRADWRRHGVGVSAICPGGVNTSIAESTRYLGAAAEKRDMALQAIGRGRSPELVAVEIVRAIRENRAVVRIGWDAKLAWWAYKVIPPRLQQFIARQGI